MEYLQSLEGRQSVQKNMAGSKRSSPGSPPACSSSYCAKIRAKQPSPQKIGYMAFYLLYG